MNNKEGVEIKHGSLITWNVWDSDECRTCEMFGILHDHTQLHGVFKGTRQFVIYLGGAADFGEAIGKQMLFEEVEHDATNNDTADCGVEVVGTAIDVVRALNKYII